MRNKRYYGFYTGDKELKDALCIHLHENGIYYELSGCYDGWHFEILLTEDELEKENIWLDQWYAREETAV